VKKEIEKIEKILNTSPDLFNAQLPEIERKILNEILLLLKDLKLRDGRIVSDGSNLKRVNSIKSKLEKVVVNKQYLNDLKTFADSFVKSADAVNAYYKSAADQFQSSPYHAAIRDTAIGNTLQSLTSIGISQNVISPIRTMLMTAVTSGQSYTALIEALRNEIVSSKDNIGSLSRYAGTYTVTALSNFTGQYMTAINRDIGWKWYRYVGSNIRSTREFCIHMTEKEYVHESEFETVLSGDIDGYQVKLNPATGLPQGMFDGTDATNFTANVGGWNCRHQLYPVPEYLVPEDVRAKKEKEFENILTSNQTPSATMPNDLNSKSNYLQGEDYIFDKRFFDLIDPSKPIKLQISNTNKNSFYDPNKETVFLDSIKRISDSTWKKKSLVYHEFGHGLDHQRQLRTSKEVLDLRTNQIKELKKKSTYKVWEQKFDNKGYYYEKVDMKMSKVAYVDRKLEELTSKIFRMKDDTFTKRGITKLDVIEQIGATRDTIKSLVKSYGHGHSSKYFSQTGKSEGEYLAHAFENAFIGNEVFKKYMPDIYNEMVTYIQSLK